MDRAPRRTAVACVVVASAVALLIAAPSDTHRQTIPPLGRFTVSADGHPLTVWARVPDRPVAAALLVHGRTWSSLPDFDLQVQGLDRSTLAAFAGRGIAAYAVDLRGYGRTPRDSSGWTTPRRSAADVRAVLAWVRARHVGLAPPALLGWSRGAAVAMLAAQSAPGDVSSLVLYGFAYDPDERFVDGSPARRPARLRTTAELAKADFTSPAVTPASVVDAFVEQALQVDPVLADWKDDAQFNDLAPAKVSMPTLIVFGDRDPSIDRKAVARLLPRLSAADKRVAVVRGGDHAAHLEDVHTAWLDAVTGWILGHSGAPAAPDRR